MTEIGWLALYSGLILAASVAGGFVPLLGRISHSRLQLYLSLSAGVMIGASFFHVMPDAIEKLEKSTVSFGWWMSLGVVGLFCIERFIAPHSHEIDTQHVHDHGHHHACDPDHSSPSTLHPPPSTHLAAAPAVAGWMAVLGLTLHTFMNGFGLAGAVQSDFHARQTGAAPLEGGVIPGLALFLAIAFHKPADALAISTVLSRKGVHRRKILLVQLGFAAMIPFGAVTFLLAKQMILTHPDSPLAGSAIDQLTGAALAFSAGTFLFIALSDLLPEVQFHRHDRLWLFLALIAGVALMGGIAYLEDLGRTESSTAP